MVRSSHVSVLQNCNRGYGCSMPANRIRSADLFPTDKPITPERMIGRTLAATALAQRLENGLHTVVPGSRRTGKTSICEAALQRVNANDAFYCTVIDLELVDSAMVLARRVLQAVLAHSARHHAVAQTASEVLGESRGALARSIASMILPSEIADIFNILADGDQRPKTPEEILESSIRKASELAEDDGVHVVLFLDEIQRLALYGDRIPEVFQKSISGSRIIVVCAGSDEQKIGELWAEGAPMGKLCSPFDLDAIQPAAWKEGLIRLFAEDDCVLAHGVVDAIVDFGNLREQPTMRMAQELHLKSQLAQTRNIAAIWLDDARQQAQKMIDMTES